MATELERYAAAIQHDEELRRQVEALGDDDAAQRRLAKSRGYEIEWPEDASLSDDQLDHVAAGGGFFSNVSGAAKSLGASLMAGLGTPSDSKKP